MENTTNITPADYWLQATGEEPVPELMQLPAQQAEHIISSFIPYAQQVIELAAMAAGIEVTEEDDAEGMAEAHRLRIAMKNVRVEADKVRRDLKGYALITGKAIDGIGRSIRERAELIEKRLEDSEKFAERKEAERKQARKVERVERLIPYVDDVTEFDLLEMGDGAFEKLFTAMKANHDAALKAEQEAEAERQHKAEEDRAEHERIRAENERLRAENAAKEAEATRLAAEMKAKQDAEAEAARRAEAAEQAAKAAPDIEKVRKLYLDIQAIEIPELDNAYGAICRMVQEELNRVLESIKEQMLRVAA